MKKFASMLFLSGCCLMSFHVQASICPDPATTSLQWGEPPAPWVVNPFSARPQGDPSTVFKRANILVAGLGRGVVCTYVNIVGEFSIWWEVLTKIPSRNDYDWIDTLGGFVCTNSRSQCSFSTAD